jgi:polyhydroxybutyrate depolymerase
MKCISKKIVGITVLIIVLVGCKKSKFDSEYHKIKHDGKKREYLLHVPSNYNEQINKSLVIALHGGLGTPKNIEEQSLLSDVSDEEGFIVCYPDGIGRTWNAGKCCGKAMKKDIDDVGFIETLIDKLINEYDINSTRIFVTGISNGGFMSYHLACKISGKIAAIAPVAATMTMDNCTATTPVSIVHFQSYLDDSVPYLGGRGNGISEVYKSPLDSVFKVWSTINNCTTQDSLIESNPFYDATIWRNCNNSTEIVWYMTNDGGHSWPMGTQPRGTADAVSTAIEASRTMWEFFDNHPKN